jgi:hypothetical protein
MTGYHGTVEDCERIGNQPPGLAVQAPPYEILVINGSTGERLQNGVYRLNTPGTTVKTDIQGYAAQLIPAGGDAPAQYDDVWASWFEGSQVTGRGPLEAIPVEGPQGRVELPVNKLITVDGSYQAYHYDQILDGRPVHGVMLLHVWQEENSSTPSGAIIIDVYDEGDSSVGWGTVYQQLLDVLLALHPKQ